MTEFSLDWVLDDPTEINPTLQTVFDPNITVDSPAVSKDDSIGSSIEEHYEKSEISLLKPTFKSILQAKKRLQAFSATKQLKRTSSKDEKTEDAGKTDKTLARKVKKNLYPLDKAQAVVQEIEEIKQKEVAIEQKKMDVIIVSLKESQRFRSQSPSLENKRQFKKREIKCRNYRRSDSLMKRSMSPEDHNKKGERKLTYPKNWNEYKLKNLTPFKDEELKSKIFPKTKSNANELITKLVTFEGPSPLLESFKSLTIDNKIENIPMSFLRITRSKPTVTYNVNCKKNKNSFLTRKQLFNLIPRDRRNIIDRFINASSSRSQNQDRIVTTRHWYTKSWKKSADAECKILENSVGLSFLQTYSDEEEEDESDGIAKDIPEEQKISKDTNDEMDFPILKESANDEEEKEEMETLTPEERPEETPEKIMSEKKEKRETYENIKKCKEDSSLGSIKKQTLKKKDKDELIETRKAIKELEDELERRKTMKLEEDEEKEERKHKKRKTKKKYLSESEEEEKPKKNKKKNKIKQKKKKYEEEDEDIDIEKHTDTEKLKTFKKKKKHKKLGKKEKFKKNSSKERKVKKSDEDIERSGDEPNNQLSEEENVEPSADNVEKRRGSKSKDKTDKDFEEYVTKTKKSGKKSKRKTKNSSDLEESNFLNDKSSSPAILNDLNRGTNQDAWKDSLKPEVVTKSKKELGKISKNITPRSRSKEKEKYRTKTKEQTMVSSKQSFRRNQRNSENVEEVRKTESSTSKKHSEQLKSKSKVEIKCEPDWESLRNKRDRHRQIDCSKESFEEFDDFPLEKDLYDSSRKSKGQQETRTPDTEEYRENWEKDPFPIWESEDELPVKTRERFNNSWESDEEIFERVTHHSKSSEPLPDTFDLEIPLNIKPFKRRQIVNIDAELESFKKQNALLSNERRVLEIEKQESKESEVKAVKEDKRCTVKRRQIVNIDTELELFKKQKALLSNERTVLEIKKEESKESEVKVVKEDKSCTFKRRQIVNIDTELESFKKQKALLSDERRVLEIEKQVSKESEVKALKEDQSCTFKRRQIVNIDTELESFKKQKALLSDERRVLEIEKQESKESEVKAVKEDKSGKRKRSTERESEGVKENEEENKLTPKLGRWDKRVLSPKMSTPIKAAEIKKEITDDDSLTNVSSTTSVNTAAVLENEYEEFMKALTGSPKKKVLEQDDIDLESGNCANELDKAYSIMAMESDPVKIQIIDEEQQIPLPPPLPSTSHILILPKDIPLIPMPKAEIVKPVPVPSPQIEIDKMPKPLINLSLSANITLDIAPKFTVSAVDSSTTTVSTEFTTVNTLPQTVEKPTLERNLDLLSFASPLTDTSLDSFKEKISESEDKRLTNKPFVFTSMVLPSKKLLLNNSSLNLGDSDDEKEKLLKPLTRLEEIVKDDETVNMQSVDKVDKVEEEEKKVDSTELGKVKESNKEVKKVEKRDKQRSRSPDKDRGRKRSPDRHTRSYSSPKRSSYSGGSRREPSPRRRGRESPTRRRGLSPKQHSPRRRSPLKRRSPAKRKHSPRRSLSPRSRRRISVSPRRKSPPTKFRSNSPKKSKLKYNSNRPRSPPSSITSPLEGLKRSVADSTISDDLLPQPMNIEEYTQSPITQFYDNRILKVVDSPKRESLDARINQVLGLTEARQQPKEVPMMIPTTYSHAYNYDNSQLCRMKPKSNLVPVQQTFRNVGMQQSKSHFVQVGNMVQILPTEDMSMASVTQVRVSPAPKPVRKIEKSHIVQVGNMLQIVPADIPPEPPLPPEPKIEVKEQLPIPTTSILVQEKKLPVVIQEKQSAETTMRLKVAERREEREKRRQERERRRKEKEKRRKEKDKRKQIKLKQRTENMIKRALELEAEGMEDDPDAALNETPTQWPPLHFVSPSKEVGKSILVRAGVRNDSLRLEKRKVVQFADGVRPGEGTSPSGGEELSSPPPRKQLPKEKRYKKTKLQKKNQKKKVKVKIIKKRSDVEESDEDDTLPPPSPPPGSPPPHIFPPRVKPQPINSIESYIPAVVQTSHYQQLYRPPQLNFIMTPHHPPGGPPKHHGPPAPGPGPQHGPPPSGPPGPTPPQPHHGPPPPGAPHHHHGPPPPFHH